MTFESLGLDSALLAAIKEEGYETPTPIQLKAIPVILSGKDMMAAAQTGTGKTAAFVLPLLQKLKQYANTSSSPARHPIRALILTPTRELASQVFDNVTKYSRYIPLRALAVFGGVDSADQIKQLQQGVEILVATPGRLLDYLQQKCITLNQVEQFVLDEADRMLDMGFVQDIRRIITLLPLKKQTLLFSATFSPVIQHLAESLMQAPEKIEVARQNATSQSINQIIHLVPAYQKIAALRHLIHSHHMSQVIVFCKTKQSAEHVLRDLMQHKISAQAIHGDRTQQARLITLTAFKEGLIKVLVATDVAARGLDIVGLPFVINFELSINPEDYVHRIGRTGRAGIQGAAITLVHDAEVKLLEKIRKLTNQTLVAVPIAGFAPTKANANPVNRVASASAHQPKLLGKAKPVAVSARLAPSQNLPALLLPRKPKVQL
jgi:superfamily II DNA/RNA helicase